MAFSTDGAASDGDPVFAQLHPAGVSRVSVSGRTTTAVLLPGMTVRVRARVDDRGRGKDEIRLIDIVTPTEDFQPDAVRPNRVETIVGTVVRATKDQIMLQVSAGRLRRITLPVADDALAVIEAADLRLITAGDAIEVKGRLWNGAGSAGSGTVFASRVTVTKPAVVSSDLPRP
ncbi:MAG: hypothetical protein ACKOTB_15900 [Planctomycetia bacterium]